MEISIYLCEMADHLRGRLYIHRSDSRGSASVQHYITTLPRGNLNITHSTITLTYITFLIYV